MATAGSLAGLVKFIDRAEWRGEYEDVMRQHLEPACRDLDVEPAEIGGILGDGHAMTLWGCMFEDFMARDLDGGRNIVDDYLKRRGYTESAGHKRYMKALRGAVMSLYEVSNVVPGESFLARDLIRGGEPVRITERSGTKTLKQWDRIGARVIQLGDTWQMGGGVLLFGREASEQIIAGLKRVEGRMDSELRQHVTQILGPIDTAKLDGALTEAVPMTLAGPLFTGIWLAEALDRSLNPRLPEMQNTDGEPLVLCTMKFPVSAGVKVSAVREALATVAEFEQEKPSLFTWLRHKEAEPEHTHAPKDRGMTIISSRNGATILGNIEISKGTVILTTNSRERARRGEALIAAATGGMIGAPALEVMTPKEALAQHDDKRAPRSRRAEPRIPPEQARVVVHTYLDGHYRKLLDEPIPVLGGISPREAAKSASGRAKVVDWLKYLENGSARHGDDDDPLTTYDLSWLWRELGVAELRA